MSHYPEYDAPRNPYDDQLSSLLGARVSDKVQDIRKEVSDLDVLGTHYVMYADRMKATMAAHDMVKTLETAWSQKLLPAPSDPPPRFLREAAPAQVTPPQRPMTREVSDQIVEAANSRPKRYVGERS
jgi:hypothetical protein